MEQFGKRKRIEKTEKSSNTSRRDFLKNIAAAGAALSVGAIGTDQGPHIFKKRTLLMRMLKGESEVRTEAVEKAKTFLKETYGVQIEFGDTWDDSESTIDPLDADESVETLRYLVEEMGKYPSDFFALNKLDTIRIGKNMSLENFEEFKVGGYAQVSGRSMVLNYFFDDPGFFRGAFHHELYHVLDFWDSESSDDKRWEQIHAGCTCTPSVHRQKFDPTKKKFDSSFVSLYGASSPMEERAEFAHVMMMSGTHAEFLSRLPKENENNRRPLERKYEAIKKDFYRWSNGQMDEKYWDAVVAKVPPSLSFDDRFSGYQTDHSDSYGTFYFDEYHK